MPQPRSRPRSSHAIRTAPARPALRVQPRPSWWKRLRNGWFVRDGRPVVYWRVVATACGLAAVAVAVIVGNLAREHSQSNNVVRATAEIQAAASVPQIAVADVRGEDRVASPTESPPSATDFSSLDDLCQAEPDELDRPPENVAAPSPQRTADAPVVAGPAPAQPAPFVMKRRDLADDEELRKQLVQVTELNLASVAPAARRIVMSASKNRKFAPHEIPDFAGLPVRMGIDCQLGKEPADELQARSRKLREALAAASKNGSAPADDNQLRRRLEQERAFWRRPEAVPALTQMLMAEAKPVRRVLVEFLAENQSRPATVALAQRALFDLAFEVREAAVQALAERPRDDFRPVLLEGFRYPWAPVADHAAEALVALKDREAAPALDLLLREPDAESPFFVYAQGRLAVRELVRINHLGNCAMCHANSPSATEPVRGRVPSPNQPLPPPVEYYSSGEGTFIRADVTYLRQDFSVPQPVPRPGHWPANQRYDYVVRLRYLSVPEMEALLPAAFVGPRPPEKRSGQKEAVLYALRELREPGAMP